MGNKNLVSKGEDVSSLADAFKVLSDPTRLRLLNFIASRDEACVCELTDAIDVSQPTVSHHLKVLTDAGLLDREKRGSWAYYTVVPATLELLAQRLTQPRAWVPTRRRV